MNISHIVRQHRRELILLLALVLMTLLFGAINDDYLSPANLIDILDQSTIYGLMALGMTLIIISGGIDLSVGSAFALMGVVIAKLAVAGYPPAVVVLAALVMGLALGAVNGVLVSLVRLQPFIATLGTMSAFRGVAYIVAAGLPILGVPASYRNTVDGIAFGNIRISVFIFLGAAVLFWIVLRKTAFGNAIFAIGGNEDAARLSGIRTPSVKIWIYAVAMLGTSLAVLVQIGKLGTGEASAAQGYELNAIAAVAIGGTSMAGGRGSIVGTILGAILLSGLKVGLIVSGVDTFYQYVATGLVIIIAASSEMLHGRRLRLPRRAAAQ